MPGFKRKAFKKGKKAFKKRAFKKTESAGVKALRIIKSMQKKIEYKHNDYALVADDLTAGGMCYPLVELIPKGTGSNQRTGDDISLARAHIYMSCFFPSGSSGTDSRTFRVMLVRGIRENGLIPTMSFVADANRGILDDTTMPLVIARKALDNMRNTKILLDKTYTLTRGQKTKMEFRWNFKLGWKAKYKQDVSGLVEDGGLYLLLCEDFNNGDILVNMNHRITFSDD